MADSGLIEGVNKNSGGGMFDNNKDLKSLFDSIQSVLTSTQTILIETNSYVSDLRKAVAGEFIKKDKNIKIKAKNSPKPNDLIASKDIPSLIANGFLLIHSDLESASKHKSGGLIGGMFSALGGAAGAFLGGAASSMFAGLSIDSTKHLKEITQQLNDDITYEDIKDNQEIKQAQIEGLASYIKAYFLGQGAAEVVKEAIGAIGPAIVDSAKGAFTSLFGIKDEETKVQLILKDLLDSMNSADYIDDPEVKKAEKIGVISYLAAYFVSQAAAMTVETAGGSIGTAIGGFTRGILIGLAGKKSSAQESKLATMIDAILDSLSVEEYINDETVRKELKTGIVAYLGAYFITQTTAMAAETTSDTVGQTAGNLVRGVISGILGLKSDNQKSKLSQVVDSLLETINPNEYVNEVAVKDTMKEGVVEYLKAYFSVQTSSMVTESRTKEVADVAGNFVKGVLSGFFKKNEENTDSNIQTKLKNIAELSITSINDAEISNDKVVKDSIKEGMAAYVKSYFLAQAHASVTGEAVNEASKKAGKSVRSFFSAMFGKEDESNIIATKLENVIKSATVILDSSDATNIAKDSLRSVIKEAFSSLESNFKKTAQYNLFFDDSDFKKIKNAFVSSISASIENIDNTSLEIASSAGTPTITGDSSGEKIAIITSSISDKMDRIIESLSIISEKTSDTFNIVTASSENVNYDF